MTNVDMLLKNELEYENISRGASIESMTPRGKKVKGEDKGEQKEDEMKNESNAVTEKVNTDVNENSKDEEKIKEKENGKGKKKEKQKEEGKDASESVKNPTDEVGVSRKPQKQEMIPDDEPVQDKEPANDKSGSFQILIDSILENLKIVIAGSQKLSTTDFGELVNIDTAVAEMPRVVTKIDPEIQLVEDPLGEWCLQKNRIRYNRAGWSDYESFLKAFRHIVEGGVKELYEIYKIKEDDYVNNVRIIPPTSIGFKNDPRECTNQRARNIIYDNADIFRIIADGQHAYSIPRAINPVLAPLVVETQAFILDDAGVANDLREWISLFIRKKDQYMAYGLRPLYGKNNVKWHRCPHPRLVGLWLNAIPNANRLSVPYTLKFIGPEANTRPVNVSSTISALQTSLSNATVLTRLATESLTPANQVDIAYILKAQLLPGQIQVDIEFDPSDPIDLSAVGALAAKLLFTVTPMCRNITAESALAADRVIGRWLIGCGYPDSLNPDQPLLLGRRRNNQRSAFIGIQTDLDTGAGWCNMRVPSFRRIENPLYEGVNQLPQMAGVPPMSTPLDFVNMGSVASPPILTAMMAALNELAADSAKCGTPVMRWFNMIQPSYIQYFGSLNRYTLTYGESGFRLSDRRMQEMKCILRIVLCNTMMCNYDIHAVVMF